jgi:polyhydroxybutyrate depolymerase
VTNVALPQWRKVRTAHARVALVVLGFLAIALAGFMLAQKPAARAAAASGRHPQTSHIAHRANRTPAVHVARTSSAHKTGQTPPAATPLTDPPNPDAGPGPSLASIGDGSAPGTVILPIPAGVTEVTGTMTVGALTRVYEVFEPTTLPTASVPALVVLHGRGVSLNLEVSRDGLLPLVAQGKAILVYPLGYGRSWNAGVCCGPAQVAGVDDVGFLTRVVQTFAHEHSVSGVYLAGFSNGGRMAYRVVCADPTLVKVFVVIDAVPSITCAPGRPVSLLQIDGTADRVVSYDASLPPHVFGSFVEPSATAEVAAWSRRNGCTGQMTSRAMGILEVAVWTHCSGGTAVEFATYEGVGHEWFPGTASTPSAADQLWAFVNAPQSVPAPGILPPRV